MLVPVLLESASTQIRWDDEVILPLILCNSIANVLAIDYDSFEALVLGHPLNEIEDDRIGQTCVNLKHLGSLSLGCLDNFFNTEGALARQNEKLVHFCGSLS